MGILVGRLYCSLAHVVHWLVAMGDYIHTCISRICPPTPPHPNITPHTHLVDLPAGRAPATAAAIPRGPPLPLPTLPSFLLGRVFLLLLLLIVRVAAPTSFHLIVVLLLLVSDCQKQTIGESIGTVFGLLPSHHTHIQSPLQSA